MYWVQSEISDWLVEHCKNYLF